MFRQFLHSVAATSGLIAGGTVMLAGLSPNLTVDIVAVATITQFAINVFLGGTTSGASKAQLLAMVHGANGNE